MPIKSSQFVRQGKKTFRFYRLSGGVYDCNILYEYGYFQGDTCVGMRYAHKKYTEYEDDPDEKDGIGGMIPIRTRSLWLGTFVGGKKQGVCYERAWGEVKNFGVYDGDGLLSEQAFLARCEKETLADGATAFVWQNIALICQDGKTVYFGGVDERRNPCGFGARYGAQTEYGFFRADGREAFEFESWEKMQVDAVEEDGFSVLREMDFFDDGDVRYTVREGSFAGGKLNGLGLRKYLSQVNGAYAYQTLAGVFADGELVFGYRDAYESGGRKCAPASFGYADGRAVEDYGQVCVYEGKTYYGETENGIPNGIGWLIESDEKACKGTFKNGKLHGIGATYRYENGEWVAYDFVNGRADREYRFGSWGVFVNGVITGATLEEFFEQEGVKKV